jgi:hypothetical protein
MNHKHHAELYQIKHPVIHHKRRESNDRRRGSNDRRTGSNGGRRGSIDIRTQEKHTDDHHDHHDPHDSHAPSAPVYHQGCATAHDKKCHKWEAQWELQGNEDHHKVFFEVNGSDNDDGDESSWLRHLEIAPRKNFQDKDVMKLNLHNHRGKFDFDIEFKGDEHHHEHSDLSESELVISSHSEHTPFKPNDVLHVYNKTTDPTNPNNILMLFTLFNTTHQVYNDFTGHMEDFGPRKNLIMIAPLTFVHINEISDKVNVSISANSARGNDVLEVCLESDECIEIKETRPVFGSQTPSQEITFIVRTIYVNQKYFMSYIYLEPTEEFQYLDSQSTGVATALQIHLITGFLASTQFENEFLDAIPNLAIITGRRAVGSMLPRHDEIQKKLIEIKDHLLDKY